MTEYTVPDGIRVVNNEDKTKKSLRLCGWVVPYDIGKVLCKYTKYFNNLEKALDFAKEHHVTDELNEDFEENCFTRVGAFTCSTIIKVWMYEDAKGNNLDKPICVWQRRVWS